jgi:hypothetical protein
MAEFARDFFDDEIVQQMNTQGEDKFFEQLMFTVSSFIYPKTVINSFEFNKDAIAKICAKYV